MLHNIPALVLGLAVAVIALANIIHRMVDVSKAAGRRAHSCTDPPERLLSAGKRAMVLIAFLFGPVVLTGYFLWVRPHEVAPLPAWSVIGTQMRAAFTLLVFGIGMLDVLGFCGRRLERLVERFDRWQNRRSRAPKGASA